ncbi:MAG UNVERIFIED_CONTAM: hypothetical protein LVR18_34160 [Planctomycetaceae bacterium]
MQQTVYKYNYSHIPGVAMLDQLPVSDEFSFRWLELVTSRVLEGIRNRCELDGDQEGSEHHSQLHSILTVLLSRELTLSRKFGCGCMKRFDLKAEERHLSDLQLPCRNLKTSSGRTVCHRSREYRNDAVFAAMRTAGPNPIMLRRLREPDERLPITEQLFRTAVPGDSLAAALAEGRLFLADYAVLDGAETGVGSGAASDCCRRWPCSSAAVLRGSCDRSQFSADSCLRLTIRF